MAGLNPGCIVNLQRQLNVEHRVTRAGRLEQAGLGTFYNGVNLSARSRRPSADRATVGDSQAAVFSKANGPVSWVFKNRSPLDP